MMTLNEKTNAKHKKKDAKATIRILYIQFSVFVYTKTTAINP